jgi:hypothetical protein
MLQNICSIKITKYSPYTAETNKILMLKKNIIYVEENYHQYNYYYTI